MTYDEDTKEPTKPSAKKIESSQIRAARRVFEQAAFVADVGMILVDIGPGWCESELLILPRHFQYEGFVHAGVQATMADHTAGTSATTLVDDLHYVLSAEFKINLLRPAQGERLSCRAEVLKAGRTLIVSEAEVYAYKDDEATLVAKATVTLVVLEKQGP